MPDLELKIRSRDIDTLIKHISEYNPDADLDLIRRAYEFSDMAHEGTTRFSGEPYITHPLEVAIILARLKLDCTTISAALLHDIVEDTGFNLNDIRKEFGEEVALLVDGVTKISHIKNRSRATAQAETLRKMLIATIRDVRVILIKLADKLHNMRTIMFQRLDKRYRIALETMELYAPLARRLGMNRVSSELEDLSFYVLYFEEYMDLKRRVQKRENEVEEYLNNVRTQLIDHLGRMGIDFEIEGRAKHLYSIFKKMQEQDKNFEEIYDIRGIRVITDEIRNCYAILGTIHTLWSPIASRFKDYIAVPKANMYQSLHTTVIGPEGHPLEVQIRTREMHATAEMGIAAHWLYKDHIGPRRATPELAILQNFSETYSDTNSSREFMTDLKMDLYEDEIFVFTPRGKIINLAKDATPVDFAYAIHTEVGNHASGAKVNNKMVPLRSRLQSGDIVEIQTSKKAHPSREWLKFVKSSNARYKIRNWLRKNNNLIQEAERDAAAAEEKRREKEAEARASVSIPSDEHIKLKKLSRQKNTPVSVAGASNVMIRLSQCCQPIPGDDAVGFVTRGRGITVHKRDCPQLKRLMTEPERLINIVWEESRDSYFPVKVCVKAIDRPNLLKDMAEKISNAHTNIIKMEAEVKEQDNAVLKFVLEVTSNDHLNAIMEKIRSLKNVTEVFKMNEKVILK